MTVSADQTDLFDFVDRELESRRSTRRLRHLREAQPLRHGMIEVDGQTLINFSSNDYLGLSFHPELKRRAIKQLESHGSGSTASRLMSGTSPLVSALETKLASIKGTERALIFNSGYQTNVSILPAIADRNSFVLMDRACHASLVTGAVASRATIKRFAHNDMDQLRDQLRGLRSRSTGRIVVVTESLFSMDGDLSDLTTILGLRAEFDTILIVDDAHAFGVLGASGSGLACDPDIDLVVGTFGKACGSFGAFVACSDRLRAYLINCSSGFVTSTALPPAMLGAIDAALDLVPEMDSERLRLHKNSSRLLATLRSNRWDCRASESQVVPVVVGGEEEAVQLAAWLEANGIFAVPIRPPTVEHGASRIRLSVTAAHESYQVDHVANLIESWRERQR